MNMLKAYDNTQGSIGDMIELSDDDLKAVSGGECTVKYGTCTNDGKGHIRCTDTVVTCK